MGDSRLEEALSYAPKKYKKIVDAILDLDYQLSYMDWNDWEEYCNSGELKRDMRSFFKSLEKEA